MNNPYSKFCNPYSKFCNIMKNLGFTHPLLIPNPPLYLSRIHKIELRSTMF